jgi:hypothetical protein
MARQREGDAASATHRVYASVVDNHIAESTLALKPLQKIRPSDLDAFRKARASSAEQPCCRTSSASLGRGLRR